jgi:outer membrane biosynthesis protein TonB
LVEVEIVKPQTRPVIVEVKRKRGIHDRSRSIWSGIDLTAVAAKVDAEMGEASNGLPVDSGALSTDVDVPNQPKVEQQMPDPQEAETVETPAEAPAAAQAPETTPKKKAPRPRKAKAAPKPRIAKETAKPAPKVAEAPPAPARAKRKTYSEKERAQLLAKIEKSIGPDVSVKKATGQAGISEQTYYQWKKAADAASAPADLNDLLALEEENKQLKKQLAERLWQENAELKKKLGLK